MKKFTGVLLLIITTLALWGYSITSCSHLFSLVVYSHDQISPSHLIIPAPLITSHFTLSALSALYPQVTLPQMVHLPSSLLCLCLSFGCFMDLSFDLYSASACSLCFVFLAGLCNHVFEVKLKAYRSHSFFYVTYSFLRNCINLVWIF